jgi:hypothetical protein
MFIYFYILVYIPFTFLRRGETESAWYVRHYLAYCASPG